MCHSFGYSSGYSFGYFILSIKHYPDAFPHADDVITSKDDDQKVDEVYLINHQLDDRTYHEVLLLLNECM